MPKDRDVSGREKDIDHNATTTFGCLTDVFDSWMFTTS